MCAARRSMGGAEHLGFTLEIQTSQGFALISLRDMGVEEVRSQESAAHHPSDGCVSQKLIQNRSERASCHLK